MIKKFFFIFVLSIITIIYAASFKCFAGSVEVSVDASAIISPIPDIFAPNIWIANSKRPENKYITEKYLKENRPAVIHLTLTSLKESKSIDDFKIRLKNYLQSEPVEIIISKVKEYNSTLIVGFETATMPGWLSSRSGDSNRAISHEGWTVEELSPPRDYNIWAEVVRYTLSQFVSQGVNNLGFFVGWEPDIFWLGSEKTLFEYYKTAANAAKTLNRKILVGGIGSPHYKGGKGDCQTPIYTKHVQKLCEREGGWVARPGEPLTKYFIEYVAENNIPIDFINWHSFGAAPIEFIEQGKNIRNWLSTNGLKDIILYVSDWTVWQGSLPATYLDTQESACYIVSSLYYMWKAGINWHGHDFDIDWWQTPEFEYMKNSTFDGQWSVFTRPGRNGGGIVKPMYNALSALTLFGYDGQGQKKLIKTSFPKEDTVVAIAAISDNNKEVSLLLSNYAPAKGEQLRKNLLSYLIQLMNLESERRIIGQCIQDQRKKENKGLQDVFACINKLKAMPITDEKKELLDLLTHSYKCLQTPVCQQTIDCIKDKYNMLKYQDSKIAAKIIIDRIESSLNDKYVRINIANLPFRGKAKISTYRIDSSHSNSCSLNRKTAPVSSDSVCGIGGIIDKEIAEAIKKSREEKIKAANGYLTSKGYTNQELQWLKENFRIFTSGTQNNSGLGNTIEKLALKTNVTPSELRNDLEVTLKKVRKAGYQAYFGTIDRINNQPDVSIKGSEESYPIDVPASRMYDYDLIMEPNSVWLINISTK